MPSENAKISVQIDQCLCWTIPVPSQRTISGHSRPVSETSFELCFVGGPLHVATRYCMLTGIGSLLLKYIKALVKSDMRLRLCFTQTIPCSRLYRKIKVLFYFGLTLVSLSKSTPYLPFCLSGCFSH